MLFCIDGYQPTNNIMSSIKSVLFSFGFVAFVLVALTQLPYTQGMPWDAKLAFMANATIRYISEFLSPIARLYYKFIY